MLFTNKLFYSIFALNWQIIQKHKFNFEYATNGFWLHKSIICIWWWWWYDIKIHSSAAIEKAFYYLFFWRAFFKFNFVLLIVNNIFWTLFILKLFLSTPTTALIKVSTLQRGWLEKCNKNCGKLTLSNAIKKRRVKENKNENFCVWNGK